MNRNGSNLSFYLFFVLFIAFLFFFLLCPWHRGSDSQTLMSLLCLRISLLKHNYQLCLVLTVLKLNTHHLSMSVLKNTMARQVFHLNFMVNDKKYISLCLFCSAYQT